MLYYTNARCWFADNIAKVCDFDTHLGCWAKRKKHAWNFKNFRKLIQSFFFFLRKCKKKLSINNIRAAIIFNTFRLKKRPIGPKNIRNEKHDSAFNYFISIYELYNFVLQKFYFYAFKFVGRFLVRHWTACATKTYNKS